MAQASTLSKSAGVGNEHEGGSLLAEIAAQLSAGGDLQALLQRFLDPVVRLAGAQGGAVRLLGAQQGTLELVSELGVSPGVCGRREHTVDRHCGHCGAAADGSIAVWAEDLSDCSARNDGRFFGRDCQRLLALPLQHRGEVLGVYNLFFESRQPAPPPEVMALLRTVGELLGLALHNAKLERTHLQTVLMQERQMMAAEVHDSLGQSLTFIKMRLPLLEDALHAGDTQRALHYCGELRGVARQAHASLRGLLTHFRSPMDPQGLLPALQACAVAFRRSTGTELECSIEPLALGLGSERESHVFHIVQEALSNVARHAGARHARLHLGRAGEGGVEVVVEDDGAGLPRDAAGSSHYGLEIMQERARRLGGTLDVGAREGGGTRVRLVLPLREGTPALEAH